MIEKCNLCDKEFLTEADSHMVIPTTQGIKLTCIVCFTDMIAAEIRKLRYETAIEAGIKASRKELLRNVIAVAIGCVLGKFLFIIT